MKAPIKFAQLIALHTDVYFYQFSYHGKMGGNGVAKKYPGKILVDFSNILCY